MEWTQAVSIIASNAAIILIISATTVAMWVYTDKKIAAIRLEMKNLNDRLCEIEERRNH